jgi:catechol 2,3-dioxygenase-like lactoylglutathione lyase family enzyme
MPTYTGINHLAMVTGDMETTIRFWRDLLGMPLVAGMGGARYRHYFFSISPCDMIAFFEWEGAEPIPEKDHGVPVTGPVAFDHLSIQVESDDDLWELKAKLEAGGFWASEVVDHGFIHSLYSFDPNNIPIEFSAPVNVDLRRCPRMTDDPPSPPALSGPEPEAGHWPEAEPLPEDEKVVYPGEGEEFLVEKRNVWDEE